MAYSTELAHRIRELLDGKTGLTEKKMFGGIAFMLNGKIACGVSGDDLMVRVGPESYEAALELSHVHVFDITGRPMTGWVLVEPAATQNPADLAAWVEKGAIFASTLPTK